MSARVFVSLVAATLSLGSGAHAADQPSARLSARLSAEGVDLADADARAALERQIDLAAARLCGVDAAAPAERRHQQNLCLIATGNAARARLATIAARRQAKPEVKLAGL